MTTGEKVKIQRRTVRAKQIQNIFEALEIRNKIKQKNPAIPVEIECTSGGNSRVYRVVIVDSIEIEVPEKPELEELPYPEFKPRAGYSGGRNKPEFGSWKQFGGDRSFRREVQRENGKVFQENKRKLRQVDEQEIAPQFQR